VVDGRYAGSGFDWVTPLAIFCGVGAVLGYALLGAVWLVLKTDEELGDWAYRRLPLLLGGVVVVIVVFAFALAKHLHVFDRWSAHPQLLLLPLAAALAVVASALASSNAVTVCRSQWRHSRWPSRF
jgi:cytochrome bd ubiquinol oxidase subunit II